MIKSKVYFISLFFLAMFFFFCVFHLSEGIAWITQHVNGLLCFVWGKFCSYMQALKVLGVILDLLEHHIMAHFGEVEIHVCPFGKLL